MKPFFPTDAWAIPRAWMTAVGSAGIVQMFRNGLRWRECARDPMAPIKTLYKPFRFAFPPGHLRPNLRQRLRPPRAARQARVMNRQPRILRRNPESRQSGKKRGFTTVSSPHERRAKLPQAARRFANGFGWPASLSLSSHRRTNGAPIRARLLNLSTLPDLRYDYCRQGLMTVMPFRDALARTRQSTPLHSNREPSAGRLPTYCKRPLYRQRHRVDN